MQSVFQDILKNVKASVSMAVDITQTFFNDEMGFPDRKLYIP